KLHQGGGGETTPPLGEKFPQGLGGKSTPSPRGKNSPTQETVVQETVKRETEAGSTQFDGSTLHINTGVTVTPGLRGSSIYVQSVWERPPAHDLSPRPARPTPTSDQAPAEHRATRESGLHPGQARPQAAPQPRAQAQTA